MEIADRFQSIRDKTVSICKGLSEEDYVIQVAEFVSPAKWHLAHTTWFFETFILKPNLTNYQEFNSEYSFLFNSYYESVGSRTIRHQRGFLSRPTVKEVMQYRQYVDQQSTLSSKCSVFRLDSIKAVLNTTKCTNDICHMIIC
jgi:hypothetical protein